MDAFAHSHSVDTAGSTAMTQYRKFETYILRKGIAGLSPNAHMHVSVSDMYIYSCDLSAYSAAGKYVDRCWKYIKRSQT
jgi:hypothetical protein